MHLSHRQNIKEPFLSFLCPFTSLHVEIKIKWRRLPPEGCGRFWGLCISAAEEMLDINGRPGQSVEKRRKDLWQREMQKRKVNGAAPPTLNTLIITKCISGAIRRSRASPACPIIKSGETDRPHRTLKNACEISQQHQTAKMTTMSAACSSAAFCSSTLKMRQQRSAPGHADR